MDADWRQEYVLGTGKVLRWIPIPSYAELEVRRRLLEPELEAAKTECFDSWDSQLDPYTQRVVEEEALRLALGNVFDDRMDHQSMAQGRIPISEKRWHFLMHLGNHVQPRYPDQAPLDRPRWIRAHLPPDLVEKVRAEARERWRKTAYLAGIVSFWSRVACAPGSRGARAALARLEKRARGA